MVLPPVLVLLLLEEEEEEEVEVEVEVEELVAMTRRGCQWG
jgi:hypothetical protein